MALSASYNESTNNEKINPPLYLLRGLRDKPVRAGPYGIADREPASNANRKRQRLPIGSR